MKSVLLIEPFYTGSHKVLMDLLHEELKNQEGVQVHLATLPGKKWHWRARTSALYFAQNLPQHDYSCVFVSCVLSLHELLGLRPDLHKAKKVIYFHENQLVYPVRKSKERDFQYGYNQIMSCLCSDTILFNSKFNQDTFLRSIQPFFKLQPDFKPKKLVEQIQPKCQVLYFPIDFLKIDESSKVSNNLQKDKVDEVELKEDKDIKIVWPHRWEFDKNPDLLFRVLFRLLDENIHNFRISILGENFTENPPIFSEAKLRLEGFIEHFGYLPSKEEYYGVLRESDIVISTADHEFFGVAMLEATYLDCYPLCPNKLVYPEIFSSKEYLYCDEEDLLKKLKNFLLNVTEFRNHKKDAVLNLKAYDWLSLKNQYVHKELQSRGSVPHGILRKRFIIGDNFDRLEQQPKIKTIKSKRFGSQKLSMNPTKSSIKFKKRKEERRTSKKSVLNPLETTKGYPALDAFLFITVMALIVVWTWTCVSNYEIPEPHCSAELYKNV